MSVHGGSTVARLTRAQAGVPVLLRSAIGLAVLKPALVGTLMLGLAQHAAPLQRKVGG